MKKQLNLIGLIVLIVLSFLLGMVFRGGRSGGSGSDGARNILYYIDPTHPSYKSDKPGIAPDCGIKLEPVYGDGVIGGKSVYDAANVQSRTVKITGERQQLIGVKVGTVEKRPFTQTIRMLGRVVVDETRVFRINATVDGWITRTYPNATGSFVKKNETLAGFYSTDFLPAQQAYLFALSSMDRVSSQGSENPSRETQMQQYNVNIQQYRDNLKNLGMGDLQIDELGRTRKYVQTVNIASPADGIILSRNVSQDQRFEKAAELYRIADLSRIWILADIFENEAQFLSSGVVAKVMLPYQNMTFLARVDSTLPQFDPVSRTLKVRLEAENQDYSLKPDMFVEVELQINYQPSIAVPVDAVVDTGLRKVVFVELGNGAFETRRVETGWRRGGFVEITRGLMNKERIVVSGNFMIDSESRMQAVAMGNYDDGVMDPVCGMYIDEKKAKAAGKTIKSGGIAYYFCSTECKHDFEMDPKRYLGPSGGQWNAEPLREEHQKVENPESLRRKEEHKSDHSDGRHKVGQFHNQQKEQQKPQQQLRRHYPDSEMMTRVLGTAHITVRCPA